MPDVNDERLRRREFLARTASAAGLAGAASLLPAGTLLEQAAAKQAAPLPSPRNMPLDHIVVVMMENRSFDHYLGWLAGADSSQHQTYRDPSGKAVATRPASTLEAEWQGCGHPDPGHGWDQGRAQLAHGFLADGSGNDVFALTYYNDGELPFIHSAAKAYTVYDRFHCSLLGPTWPNRYYMWSAQSGGMTTNDTRDTGGNTWETIFDRASAADVSVQYYHCDLPFAATFGPRGASWSRELPAYFADCAAGTLPNIAYVDPPFGAESVSGMSLDEHPTGDVRLGQAWMSDVVHAFLQSPNYQRGAMFIVYDEWGGFFDHVRPPRVPDIRASSHIDQDFGQMGFRVPAIAVSPFTRRGKRDGAARVRHTQFGFESILKLIEYRFGLGSLTVRDRYANNIGTTFDWDHPQLEVPDLPDPQYVATKPCALGGGDAVDTGSAAAHVSDLAALGDLAERFGFRIAGGGGASDLFTKPDAVLKAIRA